MGGLSGGDAVFGVKLGDDVTTPGKAMANTVKDLRENLVVLARRNREAQASVKSLSVDLGTARKMFKDTGGNVLLFRAALKDAGVSALDTRLLVNKLTGELQAQRRAVLGMDGLFKRIFDPKTIWHFSHTLNVLQKGFGAIKSVAGTAWSVASGVAGKVFDAGKGLINEVVDAAQFRENTLTSLQYGLMNNEGMDELGAKKKARGIFGFSQQLARETPLDTDQIIESVRDLTTARFTSDEATLLTRLVADQASKFQDNPGMAKQVVSFLSRVKGRGYANQEDLGDSARAAGFSTRDITMNLAKRMGITGKDDLDVAAKVRKQLGQAATVGDNTFINAVIASVEKGKSAIGDFAKQNSETLTGSISNVKSAFKDMIQSVDLQDWDGLKSLKALLGRITEAFNPTTESGKRFLATVHEVTDNILTSLDNITSKDIQSFLSGAADVALGISRALKEAFSWAAQLVKTSPTIGDALKTALFDLATVIGKGIRAGFLDVDWKGLVFGEGAKIKDNLGAAARAGQGVVEVQGLGGGNLDRNYRGAGSSGLYALTGAETDDALDRAHLADGATRRALGIAGARADGGPVSAGKAYLVGEEGPEVFVPGRSGGIVPNGRLGGVTIAPGAVALHFNGPVAGDPADIARALEPVVTSAMISALEKVNLESGA